MRNERFERPRREEEPHPEVRADFDAEDAALWNLLGLVEKASPSEDFVARTVDRARREASRGGSRPLWRRPWLRWSAGVAAAALVAVVWMRSDDEDPRVEPGPRGVGAEVAQDDLSDVVEFLEGLSEEELLVLEAGEIEAAEAEWFGG